jgi:hypothetical protein
MEERVFRSALICDVLNHEYYRKINLCMFQAMTLDINSPHQLQFYSNQADIRLLRSIVKYLSVFMSNIYWIVADL